MEGKDDGVLHCSVVLTPYTYTRIDIDIGMLSQTQEKREREAGFQ